MSDNKVDSQGRNFIRLHDVRGALVTASASLTTGTAATFITGDADYFLDLAEVTMANNSTVSATIILTNDGSTVRSFEVPAANTLHLKFDAQLPQPVKNTPWGIDMNDITGTTVSVGAIFIRKLD